MIFLVTGGAGFIGSAVVRHLINHTRHTVINLDKLTYAGHLASCAEVSDSSRYYFEQVDICDLPALTRVFNQHQPDVVMHLAAESHVDRSIDGPAEFIQTNIVGTYTLLEAARAYWNALDSQRKQAFRFHHISTDEVYGDLPHPSDETDNTVGRASARQIDLQNKESVDINVGRASARQVGLKADLQEPQDLPLFTEQTPYAPSSPYSASKASADHLVRAWHRTYGLPVLVSNCSNNYGPYHFPEKLIPHIILNALAGKPLPVYGDGQQIRDWLYVEDHARALLQVVTQGKIGETYNIGGHNEKRNIEVVETICEILDELAPNVDWSLGRQDPSTSYKSLITYVIDRPGHDRRYAINASKIAKELGWKPQETFESGMRKTVQWYLDYKDWWQQVLDSSYALERLGTQE